MTPPPDERREAVGGRPKKRAHALVAEIDEAELAARFAEIAMGLKRPQGMSGSAVLAEAEWRAKATGDPDAVYVVQCWGRMARAAMQYFGECIENGSTPS